MLCFQYTFFFSYIIFREIIYTSLGSSASSSSISPRPLYQLWPVQWMYIIGQARPAVMQEHRALPSHLRPEEIIFCIPEFNGTRAKCAVIRTNVSSHLFHPQVSGEISCWNRRYPMTLSTTTTACALCTARKIQVLR